MFFDATALGADEEGLPDGMKVDADGNLFATGPGGVHVFAPDGTHLGTIDTGGPTANCGLGRGRLDAVRHGGQRCLSDRAHHARPRILALNSILKQGRPKEGGVRRVGSPRAGSSRV